jgi:hypothetical protein
VPGDGFFNQHLDLLEALGDREAAREVRHAGAVGVRPAFDDDGVLHG